MTYIRFELIKKSKALYDEQEKCKKEECAVEEELIKCSLSEEEALKVKQQKIKEKKLAVDSKIKRTHIFGQRYADRPAPSLCIKCFIDQDKESQMVEVESDRGKDIQKFECPICKYFLHIDRF